MKPVTLFSSLFRKKRCHNLSREEWSNFLISECEKIGVDMSYAKQTANTARIKRDKKNYIKAMVIIYSFMLLSTIVIIYFFYSVWKLVVGS